MSTNASVHKFKSAMAAAGITPPDLIEFGKLHRFSTNGHKADTSGWCRIFHDGRAGVFGDFRSGFSGVWKAQEDYTLTLEQRQRRASECQKSRAETAEVQAIKWKKSAYRNAALWAEASPIQSDDPVARYLGRRGIHLDTSPLALRYHPSLPYWQDGRCLGQFPSMIGAVTDVTGKMVSLHRTYLAHDGLKAGVEIVKKLTTASESLAGCSIKLAQPSSVMGLSTIGVAEGIETALACMEASTISTVAATSAIGLERYQWSAVVRILVVFADNDMNHVGQRAAATLARRAGLNALAVRVLVPPQVDTDWADVWANQVEGA